MTQQLIKTSSSVSAVLPTIANGKLNLSEIITVEYLTTLIKGLLQILVCSLYKI
jgi:hypothetical protein